MPNKRTLGLVVILAVFLFSGLGYANQTTCYEDAYIYTDWNDTTASWEVRLCPALPQHLTFGDRLDIDKIVEYANAGNVSLKLSDINYTSSDSDIQCVKMPGISNSGRMIPAGLVTTRQAYGEKPYYNTIGLRWYHDDTLAIDNGVGYTSSGRYYSFQLDSTVINQCIPDATSCFISIKNETENPWLLGNAPTLQNYSFNYSSTGGNINLHFADLGYSIGNVVVNGWRYLQSVNTLFFNTNYIIGGGHAYYEPYTTPDNTLINMSCETRTADFTNRTLDDINIPLGWYFSYCYNGSSYNNGTRFWKYNVLKFINNSDDLISVFFGAYTGNYTSIFNVRHRPLNPMPNTSVTVSWETTIPTDTNFTWRMGAIGGGSFSAWANDYINESVLAHYVVIGNTYILENYIYQYYVQSGSAKDNNSDAYFNFMVFGSGGYPTGGGAGGSYMDNSTSHLAEAIGVNQMLIINLFAILILAVALVGTIWFTSNPILTVAVFVVGVSMLTLFGFLPYYMFIIIAIIVALGMVKLIGGIIG